MDISTDKVAPLPSEAAVATVRNSPAILGNISWLMMESPWHRARKVADFARLVLPPVKYHQFRLFHEGNVPIAYISWALLSPEAERRLLDDPYSIELEDWMSGKAIYLVDFIVARNAMRKIVPFLRQDPLISSGPVRGVKSRNNVRRVLEFFADSDGRHIKSRRIA